MSSDQRKTANAISGKTARACDSCLWKRARWFCVADDAFLCQSCDVSVHSANLLASRHQRVRLGTSSSSLSSPKCNQVLDEDDDSPPAWHRGFTRKPRTPRNAKRTKKQNPGGVVEESVNPLLPLVPEMGSDDDYNNNEIDPDPEQLFCQVPVLLDDDLNALLNDSGGGEDHMRGLEIPEFLSSDLAEFAADVETLLGDNDDEEEKARAVKVEINGDDCMEALNWNFGEEQEVEQKVMMTMLSGLDEEEESMESGSCKEEAKKSRMLLSLNYEEVISAWASQGCPWTDGTRPHFDPNDHCWPDFMGGDDHHHYHPYGSAMMMRRSDEGREARVSRYREKRRTRLFSKKIRYEVRKLNAEKRPRLKGRFVKRASLFQPPPPFPNYLLNRHL